MTNKRKLKAFTMVEIMIVIAIIVGLSALYFAKNFSSYEKTTIQSTVSKDVETLMEALENYKYNDYTNSRGGYNNASNAVVRPFLPESMTSAGGTDIQSLGFNGRIKYAVNVQTADLVDGIQKHYSITITATGESTSSAWDKATCELALATFKSAINRRMMTKKGEQTSANDASLVGETATAGGTCTAQLDQIRQ